MAAVILAQVATSFLAPGIYGALAAGASIGASSALWAVSQGLAGFAGSMVGSAIDRALFGGGAQSAEGPRLSDLTVQSSTDGAPLAQVFGTMRMAGNVIWSTGLQEISHEEDVGGGSGGGASYTTYTYQTDVAVAICQGEISGIRRIWADTKLIYDVGASNYSSLQASDARAAGIRVYPGSETQEADPLIQSIEGAASAPAYRGTAYIVFEDLQLADFGNRIPNFTFEVVKSGSVSGLTSLAVSSARPSGNIVSVKHKSGELTKVITFGPVYNWNGTTYPHKLDYWFVLPDGSWINRFSTYVHHIGNYYWGRCGYTAVADYSDDVFVLGFTDSTSRAVLVELKQNGFGYHLVFKGLHSDSLSNHFNYVDDEFVAYSTVSYGYRISKRALLSDLPVSTGNWGGLAGYGITAPTAVTQPGHFASIALPGEVYRNQILISGNYFYATTGYSPKIWRIEKSQILNTGGDFTTANLIYDVLDYGSNLSSKISINEDGALLHLNNKTVTKTKDFTNWENLGSVTITNSNEYSTIFQLSDHLFFCSNNDYIETLSYGGVSQGTQSLSVVAQKLMESGGIHASQCDLSALAADTVRGYTVSRPMTMRAALEPLMLAYHFDLVERDGQIVAVKRAAGVAATLVDDDLGASENPDSTRVAVTRNNETELPSEVSIGYSDLDTDYQTATQYARRLTATHENKVSLSLPLALTSAEAARLAEIALNAAWWSSRLSLQFTTSFEHLRLAPSDFVTLPVYGQTLTARITEQTYGAPGLMQMAAVPDLASLYTGTAVGADTIDLAQTLGLTGPMRGLLLDCVMLRDQDTGLGLYVAASGYVSTWSGGVVFKSSDGGATWAEAVSVPSTAAATAGYCTTALASADCRAWDNASTLSVRLLNGTLSSATEAAVLNGANAALVGAHGRWELLQFKTATLNGDGTYTLINLLRGRRGTEWAASQHAVYDAFILLSTRTVQDLVVPTSEIGASRQYKHVTAGKAIESVDAESLVYTGERLECLAPVLLGGGRDASGNITLNWVRRDRVNGGWNNYADIPMSEATESYEVEIYTNNTYTTVKRTLTGITSATASYSSANQVTDFGGNQSTIYVRVYQLSATTGRGHYLQGSL